MAISAKRKATLAKHGFVLSHSTDREFKDATGKNILPRGHFKAYKKNINGTAHFIHIHAENGSWAHHAHPDTDDHVSSQLKHKPAAGTYGSTHDELEKHLAKHYGDSQHSEQELPRGHVSEDQARQIIQDKYGY